MMYVLYFIIRLFSQGRFVFKCGISPLKNNCKMIEYGTIIMVCFQLSVVIPVRGCHVYREHWEHNICTDVPNLSTLYDYVMINVLTLHIVVNCKWRCSWWSSVDYLTYT